MPNHVTNRLIVTGPEQDVGRMINAVGESSEDLLSCDRILPMPFELRCYPSPNDIENELMEQHGAKNWYEWALENWGTKWGVYDCKQWQTVILSNTQTSILKFMSAWSPPTPVIVELSKYFPELEFTLGFIDEGMGFAGTCSIKNGNCQETVIEDHQSDAFKTIEKSLLETQPES